MGLRWIVVTVLRSSSVVTSDVDEDVDDVVVDGSFGGGSCDSTECVSPCVAEGSGVAVAGSTDAVAGAVGSGEGVGALGSGNVSSPRS